MNPVRFNDNEISTNTINKLIELLDSLDKTYFGEDTEVSVFYIISSSDINRQLKNKIKLISDKNTYMQPINGSSKDETDFCYIGGHYCILTTFERYDIFSNLKRDNDSQVFVIPHLYPYNR